jgi:DNA-binding winged helix-turn-helix (wHTH) protein/tetratricopeptide (TPR) repeat protein
MPHSNNLSYHFGPFRFDVALRVLTKDGEVISLGNKAAEVLRFLLHNAGNLVGKEELMTEVWPNSFVEESNLTQNIFTLRKVLGDDRVSARYIETVPRRGYRFVAQVRKSETGTHPFQPNEDAEASEGQVGPPPKLGVLPFLNATGSDGFEYLTEGISDHIINNLSRISKLRVMSRSFMFRYKGTALEPKKIAFEMKLDAMLVGKITSRPTGMTISAELVDGNGFMLWGDSFDCELKDILEIQDEIARQISAALRLKLTGEEEKRMTTRYTENSEAYQAYMEGRFHWSRYTRTEIEKAIEHFRAAIELDPNYALAYSGIVDCYLRLATNYLPPENYLTRFAEVSHQKNADSEGSEMESQRFDSRLTLRHEWDWKGAEREIRRANELKTDYPAAHQWHVAHLRARQLVISNQRDGSTMVPFVTTQEWSSASSSRVTLTPSEQVQVFCTIAREQIAVGNYEGASLIIGSWLPSIGWPRLDKLNSHMAADLLFTLGTLIVYISGTGEVSRGQKRAESFLNGAIAILEQLNSRVRAAEARIELARCYYRQGFFEEAREVLRIALADLPQDEPELKSLCLVLFGTVERDSGRLSESLSRLEEAVLLGTSGQLLTGRWHHELATTFKELAISDGKGSHMIGLSIISSKRFMSGKQSETIETWQPLKTISAIFC